MHLHIIGGFLGSGKTTAIIGAAKQLSDQGLKVGVITNDQGRHLVDTVIIRSENLPVMEVTNGCFCCNFDDLNQRLAELVDMHKPEVIFAESVGSCADVVATVVKPLLELDIGSVKPNSFSVFTDIRLFKRFILGQEMPFSENVNYIFSQQIEEAGLLIINKIDLLPINEQKRILKLAKAAYPDKPIFSQSSLNKVNLKEWIEAIQEDRFPLPDQSLELDYSRYAKGEGRMVWLDMEYQLTAEEKDMPAILMNLLSNWQKEITIRKWHSGHIKIILNSEKSSMKISMAQSGSLHSQDFSDQLSEFKSSKVNILLNVLVESGQDHIADIFETAIIPIHDNHHVKLSLINQFDRRPGFPKPTYRIE
jgi:G3E family GTPase